MQVTCHLCRLRFDVEASEASSVRCPRCEGKIKIDPVKLQEQSELQAVGCPGCLNLLAPTRSFPIQCRYCGQSVDQEAGLRMGETIKGLEGRVKRSLLEGRTASEMVQHVQGLGVPSDQAFGYVDRLVLEVPFARHPLWKKGETPCMANVCDSCGVAGELRPYQATWTIREEERQRYSQGWGGFTDELKQTRPALYFLCKNCPKMPPEKFAGGYPARHGFTWNRLELLKDIFPQPPTHAPEP